MPAINSLETELTILGSVLYEPKLLPRVLGHLEPADFFDATSRHVFSTMSSLYERGLAVNIQSITNELVKERYTGITREELFGLVEYAQGEAAVITFCNQLSEFSGYRTLSRELERIAKLVKKQDAPIASYLSELSSLATLVNNKGVRQDVVHGEALVATFIEMLEREQTSQRLTGISEIDTRIVDFDSKEITLIAARPGVGKTAMLLQSARTGLATGKRVGIISMEMSADKIMTRLVSSRAEIDGTELLKHGKQLVSRPELHEAISYYQEIPLFVDDQGPFTNVTVPQKIRKLVYEHECDVVYVDYIGLIGATGELAKAGRNFQLSQISGDLKGLASELDIPIVAAAQLNREVSRRMSGKPTLADLRDSGALEQDASLVVFLYPDMESMQSGKVDEDAMEDYLRNQKEISVVFEVAKQRNGEVFTENVIMRKQYGQFVSQRENNRTY